MEKLANSSKMCVNHKQDLSTSPLHESKTSSFELSNRSQNGGGMVLCSLSFSSLKPSQTMKSVKTMAVDQKPMPLRPAVTTSAWHSKHWSSPNLLDEQMSRKLPSKTVRSS